MIHGNLNHWSLIIMKIDKSKGRILYLLLFIVLLFLLVYSIFQFTSPSDSIMVKTYKISDGWGYKIIIKDKVFINQPFIPVLPGKNAFPDKKSALKAGKIVKEKLINHQRPSLTKEDIKEIGLDSLGNLN
jgi:hypothetical protein